MKIYHVILALIISLIWGLNFSIIDIALREFPPILVCALRFLLVSLPAIFFVQKPVTNIWNLVFYGLLTFSLQFALIFLAMKSGVSAGLAALIVQSQVVFTVAFAAIIFKEPIQIYHIIGAMVALIGIGIVGRNIGGTLSVCSILLVIGAAISWAGGNIISKIINTNNLLGLVAWGSFFAWPPLLIFSYFFEKNTFNFIIFTNSSFTLIACLTYLVYPVTLFGYSAWSYLLNRYPAGVVTPFALFVPVFALLCSATILGEAVNMWKVEALLLIVSGVGIVLYGKILGSNLRRLSAAARGKE